MRLILGLLALWHAARARHHSRRYRVHMDRQEARLAAAIRLRGRA